MTAPDPRLGEIEANLCSLLGSVAFPETPEERHDAETVITKGVQYLLAELRMPHHHEWQAMKAELRKKDDALARVEGLAKYLDGLASGDKHYARLIRAAVADPAETVTVRELLGIDPDFTGGLSVDEYMDEQRVRGGE